MAGRNARRTVIRREAKDVTDGRTLPIRLSPTCFLKGLTSNVPTRHLRKLSDINQKTRRVACGFFVWARRNATTESQRHREIILRRDGIGGLDGGEWSPLVLISRFASFLCSSIPKIDRRFAFQARREELFRLF